MMYAAEYIMRKRVRHGIEGRQGWLADSRDEVLPCLDPVEQLEQQHPEHNVGDVVVAVVDDLLQQVLADPIRSTVRVRESVTSQDGVLRPWRGTTFDAAEEHRLSFGGEVPVRVEHIGDLQQVPVDGYDASTSSIIAVQQFVHCHRLLIVSRIEVAIAVPRSDTLISNKTTSRATKNKRPIRERRAYPAICAPVANPRRADRRRSMTRAQ
jgi:hypothetical protein